MLSDLPGNCCCSFVAFLLIWTTSACAWRTAETDHFIGPIRFQVSQPDNGADKRNAYMFGVESVLPFMIEAGEQNGLTVGFTRRITAYPIDHRRSSSIEWCQWPFSRPCPTFSTQNDWNWSFIYLQIEHKDVSEFLDRQIIGASVGIGTEGRYLTIGYAADTELRPHNNAYYIFCYTRENPLKMRFIVAKDSTEFVDYLRQEACR